LKVFNAFGTVTKTFGKIRTSIGGSYSDAEFYQLFDLSSGNINTTKIQHKKL
jgi:hypothetical protein